MMKIHKNDVVKVISGSKKGTTGKVVGVNVRDNTVLVEGIGVGHRHVKPNQLNPRGGKKDIHVPIGISKVQLVVDEKNNLSSRIGMIQKADGSKVRLARKLKNKEIK